MSPPPDFAGGKDALLALIGPADASGCMPWLGKRKADGTPYVRVKGRRWVASRYAWHLINGPVPGTTLLWPDCGNAGCMNIRHFRLGRSSRMTPSRVKEAFRCDYPAYSEITAMGGAEPYLTAVKGARRRGIAFDLTLAEWWEIWQSSGHWSERGIHGYHMCRKGDLGPYAVGNVYIGHWTENLSDARAIRRTKSAGINPMRNGRFGARVRIHGRALHLGCFATAAEATAAYASYVEANGLGSRPAVSDSDKNSTTLRTTAASESVSKSTPLVG